MGNDKGGKVFFLLSYQEKGGLLPGNITAMKTRKLICARRGLIYGVRIGSGTIFQIIISSRILYIKISFSTNCIAKKML